MPNEVMEFFHGFTWRNGQWAGIIILSWYIHEIFPLPNSWDIIDYE